MHAQFVKAIIEMARSGIITVLSFIIVNSLIMIWMMNDVYNLENINMKRFLLQCCMKVLMFSYVVHFYWFEFDKYLFWYTASSFKLIPFVAFYGQI